MIINSLLDNDLYAFTQGALAHKRYSDLPVTYAFKCRTPHFDFSSYFSKIVEEINNLGQLSFSDVEIAALNKTGLFNYEYLQWLSKFKFRPAEHVSIKLELATGELILRIKGKWQDTIFYETPVLAIISEICNKIDHNKEPWNYAVNNLFEKRKLLQKAEPLTLFEFGTRRRYSYNWQEYVIMHLSNNGLLSGTSNVFFGSKYKLPIIGTVAHQYFQVMQAVAPKLEDFLTLSLDVWMEEYPNSCKTTLTDIVGYKAFLEALTPRTANHYVGYRHDSGSPYKYGNDLITRLQELKIDPKTKIIPFSDGLNVAEALALRDYFKDKIEVQSCIGTNLVNDFAPLQKSLSIVIKMVECNNLPVCKISDEPNKSMAESLEYAEKLKKMFYIP